MLVVIAVLAVASTVGGAFGYRHHQSAKQLTAIRDTINAFAEASDAADTETMASLMCGEEAAQFTDGMEGSADGGPIKPAERQPVNIGAITVDGDNATASVTRPPTPTVTLKLKHENDAWKLCNPD